MNDRGYENDDYFRPSNFLKEPRQWSTSELDQLDVEVTLWRAKTDDFDSPSADKLYLDFRTFLGLVSKEVGRTRDYLDVSKQFDSRLGELWSLTAGFGYDNSKYLLEMFRDLRRCRAIA
ncbi:MAG: hypothetical protein ACYDBH_19930 [Acidobacteriaceae bacterium]